MLKEMCMVLFSLSMPKIVKYSSTDLDRNPKEGIIVVRHLWLLIQFCGSQGGTQGMDSLSFPSSGCKEHFYSSHARRPW